jgi:hypothetical protein
VSQRKEVVIKRKGQSNQPFLYLNKPMRLIIRIVSILIILLGVIHLTYAFPLHVNENTLWFVGAGLAIIFAGLINFVVIERSGSKFSLIIAVIVNAINFGMFCFALAVYNEPMCYVNLVISGISTIAFIVTLIRTYQISN